MMMIEISESKLDKMSEYMGKVLKYGSKVMECLDDAANGYYGEREGDMGYRHGRSGYRSMGYRDEDGEDMYDDYGNPRMGMRRMRDARGRYM